MTSLPPAARLTRACVIAFLEPRHSGPVENLRVRWDPVAARQIAAHVTLVYPEDFPSAADPGRVAATAAANTAPFRIAIGPAFHVGSPADGVFLRVHDLDDGIARFRAAAALPARLTDFPSHVTIVHPRTSDCGHQAWDELDNIRIDGPFTITYVAVTAHDGNRWQTLRLLPLTGTSRPAGT